MATAREIALDVLPHFAQNVLAGVVGTYGLYAKAIGRDPALEAMIIGPAMHAIGATCVLATIPVAPLYFVQRADGNWRGVFEEDDLERVDVLPHYDLLYVAARECPYSPDDFARVEHGLRDVIPNDWSPHFMWHYAVANKPTGSAQTYFERALDKYRTCIQQKKSARP